MRIIKNQNILQRQSENYIKGELSNVASVVQTNMTLVEYWNVNVDSTFTAPGFKNVTDLLGETSNLMWDHIEKLPMSGIDTLVSQSTYDEEVGYDEDLQGSAIIFPNTIIPKPYDVFLIPNQTGPVLYIVTEIKHTLVRSNPFTEISFRLLTRDPALIAYLKPQTKDHYITTVTAIGADKSLVIKKSAYYDIQQHVENYIDLTELYRTLFYDRSRSSFIFSGLYNEELDIKQEFLDMTLWKFMFDEGIVIYDDVITYAINNYNQNVQRIYTSCPDVILDDHIFRRSIIWRLYTRDRKHRIDEYKYPQSFEPDPRIGKYKGKNLIYFEHYGEFCDCNLMCELCPVWDEEFICRLYDNMPYPTEGYIATCEGCHYRCKGKKRMPVNPYLRNALIDWFNEKPIDWENLTIEDARTSENYFLLPILLGIYKLYIHDLQK